MTQPDQDTLTVKVTLDPETALHLLSQKPRSLATATFCALLIEQGLDKPETALIMEERPRRGSSINSSSLEENTIKTKINKCAVAEELTQHEDLIREFWKVKKGSKGQTAWKLLQGELSKLQGAHGDAVVRQQLELAINGKWQGVSAARYEQFNAPKGTRPNQPPEPSRHPAGRLFQNGRFVDDESATTNPVLSGLF